MLLTPGCRLSPVLALSGLSPAQPWSTLPRDRLRAPRALSAGGRGTGGKGAAGSNAGQALGTQHERTEGGTAY